MVLSDLATDILLHIFQFCNINDLCRLKQTCLRFNSVIEYYFNLILTNPALVTNQQYSYIKDRSAILLTGIVKWQVSHNWKIGKYKEKAFLYERTNYIPWLHLTKNIVWISRGPFIKAYRRQNGKIDVRHPLFVLSGNNLSDVSRFSKKDHCLVSGQSDGALWIWSKMENKVTTSTATHQKEINSVDIHKDLVVSGSRDCSFKLWSCRNNFTQIDLTHTQFISDRIWCTSFNENGSYLAIGTSGCDDTAALKIYDVHSLTETYSLGAKFQKGAGVLDMKWESDKVLLACGYDSCVRKWDLRTGNCVQSWEDPFYGTIYCLDSDKVCTLIIGTQSYGRIVLFDTRQTKYSQMYFMQTCKMRGRSSPVYSLSFDATQLFVATDQHLNVLDFTDKDAKVRNYSELYHKEINIYL